MKGGTVVADTFTVRSVLRPAHHGLRLCATSAAFVAVALGMAATCFLAVATLVNGGG